MSALLARMEAQEQGARLGMPCRRARGMHLPSGMLPDFFYGRLPDLLRLTSCSSEDIVKAPVLVASAAQRM